MPDTDACLHTCRPPKLQPAVVECLQVMSFVVPIAQIIIGTGALNLHDCPRQPFIPIYLVVMEVVSLLQSILQCHGKHNSTWSCLVYLFLFSWFVAGNVWIYSIYEPNYNKTASADTYCNRTVYLFAFWIMNLNYIVLGFLLFCT